MIFLQKILLLLKIILLFIIFSLINPIYANTLDDVKKRGYVNCGVAEDFLGFAVPNDKGEWEGFDVDLCRAVSVAIFGNQNSVNFIPTNTRSRFPLLAFGDIDLLIRNTTWSYSRDINLEFDFVGTNFYDGQAFITSKSLEINSVKDLDGASICVNSGTSNELNTKIFFDKNLIKFKPVLASTFKESLNLYIKGACDAYTADLSVLAASKLQIPDSYNHIILPEIISREPLGPLVRHNDNNWGDLIRWTLYVLIIAEEKSINSENIDEYINSVDSEILRLLGEVGTYGDMLELDNKWAYNIIKQMGNYATIYEKNLGKKTILGLDRGMNNLWVNGGMLYAPPFR